MFGSSKKRIAALREQVEYGRELAVTTRAMPAAVLRDAADSLTEALAAVSENDTNLVYVDSDVEALVLEAQAQADVLKARAKERARDQRRREDATVAPAIIERLRLKRCPVCSGGTFFVRERVRFETSNDRVELSLVVCAACGDVRMCVASAEVLQAIEEDRQYKRVELPGGAGPFRG
jgi:hypothetical protein